MGRGRLIGFDAAGIARARALGKLEHATSAKRVAFDSAADLVLIRLRNGTTIGVPRRLISGLRGQDKETARRLRVSHQGDALQIPRLDIHISVRGLLRTAVLGEDPYARAGRVTSPAKGAAARANGAKGGRPRAAA